MTEKQPYYDPDLEDFMNAPAGPYPVPAPSPEGPRCAQVMLDGSVCGKGPDFWEHMFRNGHDFVPAPSPEEPVEAGEHVDLGWERSKFRCSCGEQFATQQEMTAHTPIQLRIRSAKPPSPEGDQRCACGDPRDQHIEDGPCTECGPCMYFEPTGAGQAEAPAPAVESEGEAQLSEAPAWSTAGQPASAWVDRLISWYTGYKRAHEAIDDLRTSRQTLIDELERREAAIADEARRPLLDAIHEIRELAWAPADGTAIRSVAERALGAPEGGTRARPIRPPAARC